MGQPPPDAAFAAYLATRQGDGPFDLDAFLRDQPKHLRAELRRMIEDHQALEAATEAAAAAPHFAEGQVIGDFLLLHHLGKGGMGSVWEAEQISLQRRVALKLLDPYFAFSPVLLKRFHREAQSGGRLQHPGIVQVYGYGDANGIPWICQELVPGGFTLADALIRFRAEPAVPAGYYRRTAELFAQVAEALEVAHQAGVIHRDLKPANILIGEDERPKVADFGLAQLQGEKSLTATGGIAGTPFYMSPEQASAKRIGLDHRTDIFSFGVMFYEALTLTRPFEGDTSQQIFRKILTEEPRDPRKIRSRVPRDLSVICGKCLEKNPDRRYATMAELAADLRRHLAHQPIAAKAPGPLLRAGKWCRRHPVVSVNGAVAAVALVVMSWSYSQVVVERGIAVRKATTTERSLAFMRGMFVQEDPAFARGGTITVREVLDKATEDLLSGSLDGEQSVRAELMLCLGSIRTKLGLLDDAEFLLKEADALFRSVDGEDSLPALKARMCLAEVYQGQSRFDLSGPLTRELNEQISRLVEGESAGNRYENNILLRDSLIALGAQEYLTGHYEKAASEYERAMAVCLEMSPPDVEGMALLWANLTALLVDRARQLNSDLEEWKGVREKAKEGLEYCIKNLKGDHPYTIDVRSNYALSCQSAGPWKEAGRQYEIALQDAQEVLGKKAQLTQTIMNNLAVWLKYSNEPERAEAMWQELYDAIVEERGEDNVLAVSVLNNISFHQMEVGKLSQAEAGFRKALVNSEGFWDADHPNVIVTKQNLASVLSLREEQNGLGSSEPQSTTQSIE